MEHLESFSEEATFGFPLNCSILLSVGRVCSDELLMIFKPFLVRFFFSSSYFLSLLFTLLFLLLIFLLILTKHTIRKSQISLNHLDNNNKTTQKKIAKKKQKKNQLDLDLPSGSQALPKQLPPRKKRSSMCPASTKS